MKTIFALLLIAPVASMAQDRPTADVRALNARVIGELNSNLQCSSANFSLQDKLAVAEAEVKRLKDKNEPAEKPLAETPSESKTVPLEK